MSRLPVTLPSSLLIGQIMNRLSRSNAIRLGLVALLVAAVATFFALGGHRYFQLDTLFTQIDQFRRSVDTNLALSLAIFAGVYIGVTALSLPIATPLSLLAGALFGRWLGTGLVVVSATVGGTLAMLLARYVFRDVVERRFGTRLAAIRTGIDRDGAFYLWSLRLVPLFPFFLVNLAMGLTRMRVRTFAIVSLLGMLPGTFVYVNAGTEVGQIQSTAGLLSPTLIISFALLGIVPLVLRLLVRRLRPTRMD